MNAKKAKAIRKYADNKDKGLSIWEKDKLYQYMKSEYTKANVITNLKNKIMAQVEIKNPEALKKTSKKEIPIDTTAIESALEDTPEKIEEFKDKAIKFAKEEQKTVEAELKRVIKDVPYPSDEIARACRAINGGVRNQEFEKILFAIEREKEDGQRKLILKYDLTDKTEHSLFKCGYKINHGYELKPKYLLINANVEPFDPNKPVTTVSW